MSKTVVDAGLLLGRIGGCRPFLVGLFVQTLSQDGLRFVDEGDGGGGRGTDNNVSESLQDLGVGKAGLVLFGCGKNHMTTLTRTSDLQDARVEGPSITKLLVVQLVVLELSNFFKEFVKV